MASVKPFLQDENLRLRRRLFQLEQTRSRQLSDYVFAHIAIAFDLDIEIVKKIFDAGRGAFLRHKQKFCEACPVLNFDDRNYYGRVGGGGARYLQDRRRPGQRINRYAGTGDQYMGDFVGGRFYCLERKIMESDGHWCRLEFLLNIKDKTFHINGLTYKVGLDDNFDYVVKIVNEKKRDMLKNPIFQALGKGTIKQLQVKSYLLKDDEFQ